MGSGADNMWEDIEEAAAERSRKYLEQKELDKKDDSLKRFREYMAQRQLKLDNKETSDGSSASYYELPDDATELQDLISDKNMNAQIGEIFRECYRYGRASHSDEMRGIKKILFYAKAELTRLQNLEK